MCAWIETKVPVLVQVTICLTVTILIGTGLIIAGAILFHDNSLTSLGLLNAGIPVTFLSCVAACWYCVKK